MDGSLDQITDCLNFIETNQEEMYKSECRLSGATRLLIELMLVKGGKRSDEAIQISNAFCPFIWNYTDEFGWEESVYTALTFLKSQVISTQSAGMKLESKKLKKAIKSVLEKVGKGSTGEPSPSSVDNSQTGNQGEKKGDTLIGNELQERMTSARGRRTRPHNPVLDTIPEPSEAEEVDTNRPYHPPPLQPPSQQESAAGSPEETNNLVALRDTYEQELSTNLHRNKTDLEDDPDDDDEDDAEDNESNDTPLGYHHNNFSIENDQQHQPNDTPFLEEYLPKPNNYSSRLSSQQQRQKSPPPPPSSSSSSTQNKLLIDADASSTSENIISDENFW